MFSLVPLQVNIFERFRKGAEVDVAMEKASPELSLGIKDSPMSQQHHLVVALILNVRNHVGDLFTCTKITNALQGLYSCCHMYRSGSVSRARAYLR